MRYQRAPDHPSAGFRRLCVATVAAVLILVVVGGVVRVTESGLGCPDWPLCHGRVIPPADAETLIEYSHRLVASIVGMLVLVMTVWTWLKYRHLLIFLVPCTLGLVLVIAQGALGGATVLTELEGELVTAHLALAEALLALFILISLSAIRGISFSRLSINRTAVLAGATALGVYVLLITGSIVTTSGASGVCNDWPLCQGGSFMSGKLPAIHMAHRYVAVVAGVLVLATVVWTVRGRAVRPDLALAGAVAGALFLAQVVVGAVAVWSGLPAELRALHLALATTVWAALAAVALLPYANAVTPAAMDVPKERSATGLSPVTQ